MVETTIENSVLFFDTETTGLPDKGAKWENDFKYFPNIASLAWIYKGVEKHFIIYPDGWEIPLEATAIHGITTEYALEHGVKIEAVLTEFAEDILKAEFVAAHNIYFDSSVVKANVLKHLGRQIYDEMRIEDGLYKGKRIDTMMKTIKFVGALYDNGRPGKFPRLEELYNKLFPDETFDAHNALADCVALKRCLPCLIELGIITLAIKEYPTDTAVSSPVVSPKIDFKQSPVVVPGAVVEDVQEQIKEAVRPERREVGNYESLIHGDGLSATNKSLLDSNDEF